MNFKLFNNIRNITFIQGLATDKNVIEFVKKHPDLWGFGFIGRSNVGKSTLLNKLFGKKIAHTSKTPGRTQQINVFKLEGEFPVPIYIFDLPGAGHAQVSKQMVGQWNKLLHTFFEQVPEQVTFLHLMDARHPLTKVDLEIATYLKKMDIRPLVAFCKYDKLKRQSERAMAKKYPLLMQEKKIKALQVHFISSQSSFGIDELQTGLTTAINVNLERITQHLIA